MKCQDVNVYFWIEVIVLENYAHFLLGLRAQVGLSTAFQTNVKKVCRFEPSSGI